MLNHFVVFLAAAAPPAPPATNSLQATSIVLLKVCIASNVVEMPPLTFSSPQNLVGPGEVDADLKIETTAECAKFGAVTDCVIYECPPNTTPPEEAVRIFVRFQDIASATRARAEMDGRFFGGRRVTASFFDEGRFQRQQWL